MTRGVLAGAAFAALAFLSAAEAQAQTCSMSCNTQHTTCTQAGKDYGTCMGLWRQCRTACLAPARTSAAPPARVTPAVVRR